MDLQNHLLIATPEMQDDYFYRSVIYLCEHNEQGSMGLVLTAPTDLSVLELLTKMDFMMANQRQYPSNQIVLSGGPVNQDRGFILHTHTQKTFEHSYPTSDTLTLTTSGDILDSLGTTDAPSDYAVFLGCATWKPDQLENEILENVWLVSPSYHTILFDIPYMQRWEEAQKLLSGGSDSIIAQAGWA